MFRIVHKVQDHVDNSELYINGLNCDILKKKNLHFCNFLEKYIFCMEIDHKLIPFDFLHLR